MTRLFEGFPGAGVDQKQGFSLGDLLPAFADAAETDRAVNRIGGALASGSVTAMVFGFLALILASVNIFGGFMVTSRMLAMYKKKDK
jgi:hypothetical protein